jgi:hypothetical protein
VDDCLRIDALVDNGDTDKTNGSADDSFTNKSTGAFSLGGGGSRLKQRTQTTFFGNFNSFLDYKFRNLYQPVQTGFMQSSSEDYWKGFKSRSSL